MSSTSAFGDVLSSPLPLLPLRTGVLFPSTRIALPVGRPRSVALLRTLSVGSVLLVVAQKDAEEQDPTADDLHRVGTVARVLELGAARDGTYRLVLEGIARFELGAVTATDPYFKAEGRLLDDLNRTPQEADALANALRAKLQELTENGASAAPPIDSAPGALADRVASGLQLPDEKELEVLRALDVSDRLRLVVQFLAETKERADVQRTIDQEVRKTLGKGQREAVLREQLKAIQKELGDEGSDELGKLKERLEAAKLPEDAQKVVDRELGRIAAMSPNQAEFQVIRTYLETIADLPWSARADVKDDLDGVAKKLDEDHAGLDEVKTRILEHLAVQKLADNPRGTILCLHGPPGVGKTSLAQSIADATGRPLARISLGGVRDEADIRGHRRTYVGALPGRVLHALKKAKVKNPIILLDEIDKLGKGWQGSPEAALLEVLDPEQNGTFTDHYLEMPFDLSEVVFFCTANDLSTLSPPLRDRLEIIDLPGYTENEKVAIGTKHLVPKELRRHGVDTSLVDIKEETLHVIVRDYTREAGVRQLTREIDKICRAMALRIAKSVDARPAAFVLDTAELEKILGKPRFFADVAERTAVPGVATGLAWTPVGGDILFIETSRMPGKGGLEITGQLGDVMKESARAALTYVRSNAERLGVDSKQVATEDVHIHVPAGATPKDGPSAGVTIFTALTSLFTGRRVRSDTAMTGECTLRGKVLPVGGIKSKVMAAHRAGISRVILPKRNQRDVSDVPEEIRNAMTFIFAEDMTDVIGAALEDLPVIVGGEANGQTQAAS